MNQKGLTPILIILLVVLAFILGAVLWGQYLNYSSVRPVSHTSNTPTPTVSSSAQPMADWKTYANNSVGYSIEYPPSLTLSEQDAKLSQPNFPTVGPLVLLESSTNKTALGWAGDIMVGNNPHNLSIEDFSNKYIGSIPPNSSYQTIMVGNNKAKLYTDLPRLVSGEDVYFENGQKIYYFAYHVGSWSENDFRQMLASFKFIQ